jgi:dethiobiotin synthetase
MHGFFVTSSGTEIGKTWVTRCLIVGLLASDLKVRALKPVISGWDDAELRQSDTGQILDALGLATTPAEIDAVSPWRFTAPLSPDMAARREGRAIDFEALEAFCRQAMSGDQDVLLVEGVGGVMVPLDDKHTVLDWIAALDMPAVLVVGSYLGTISHTLTAHTALRARDITVPLVVVNDTGEAPVPLGETKAALARFMPETMILTLPRRHDDAIDAADGAALVGALLRS